MRNATSINIEKIVDGLLPSRVGSLHSTSGLSQIAEQAQKLIGVTDLVCLKLSIVRRACSAWLIECES